MRHAVRRGRTGEIATLRPVKRFPSAAITAALLSATLFRTAAAAAETPEAGKPGVTDEVAALLAGTFD